MMRRRADNRAGRRAPRAFTLTELMVVVVIMALILAVAVPGFTSIIYSQEATLAQTRLSSAVRAARDAALQSTGGADTAAVFFFEPGGRLRIVTCIKAGELVDLEGSSSGIGSGPTQVIREVFVPLTTVDPVELPRNWMVRGYAPANSISVSGSWYEQAQNVPLRYGGTLGDQPSWVFPETGFFNPARPVGNNINADNVGQHRQTFMVRFQAGSGVMTPTSVREVLVLAPYASREARQLRFPGQPEWERADLATDYRRFVRRLLTTNEANVGGSGLPYVRPADQPNRRQQLLGDQSPDTVLARPVWKLAVYDERRLASALGVQVDRQTGSLYRPVEVGASFPNHGPRFVDVPGRNSPDIGTMITQWIGGQTRIDPSSPVRPPNEAVIAPRRNEGDQPEARIFVIDRFTGAVRLVEVEP